MTYFFSFLGGSTSWRFPIAFQLVFSVILLGTVPWLPESPRWLLSHGFEEEGVDILVALEGENASRTDESIVKQKQQILEAVRLERDSSPSWRDVLNGKTGESGMVQRLLLGAGKVLCARPNEYSLSIRDAMDAAIGWHQCHQLLVRRQLYGGVELMLIGLVTASHLFSKTRLAYPTSFPDC